VDGTVHQGDFWKFEPEELYDLVLSLGFIEHFDDVDAAFARHLALLRPGGRLVLEVPNFQGIGRLLQRWCDPDWLALHNMDAMGHQRYLKLAAQHGLDVLAVHYFGGFDSAHISVRRHGKYPVGAISRFRQWGLFPDGVNSRWWSIGLLLVLRRPKLAP
jgi:SAM-dependent methyltransferase